MQRIDITLSQLETLLAVAKHQSFSRAAQELGMSQSAVSHSVGALEQHLNVPLLERGPHGAAMRGDAALLFEHARAAVAAIDRLRSDAACLRKGTKGTLRIGTFPSTMVRLVPHLLGAFRRVNPQVVPSCFSGTASQMKKWLARGIVDAGFVELPASELDVAAQFEDDLMAVVPSRSALARKNRLRLADLGVFPTLLSQYGCEPLIEAAHRQARVARRVDMEVQDMATLLAMVKEGIGYTLLPRLAIPYKLSGVAALPIHPAQKRVIGFALCGTSHRTEVLGEFVAVCVPLLSRMSKRQRSA